MTISCSLADLASLVPGAVLVGEAELLVSHITEDSRKVRSGSLFVARQGESSDGRLFVADALRNGAAAILCQAGEGVSFEPRLEVADLAYAWGMLAQAIHGHPSQNLKLVGITGTNGKTTVASLVCQALDTLGRITARSGTLGFYVGPTKVASSLTTPMPDQLASLLTLAKEQGASHCVLEVSSHALAQQRVAGLHFEVVAFTNLSQDHLDYHGSLEQYRREKERLFDEYPAQNQVFNLDDEVGARCFAHYQKRCPSLGVSAAGAAGAGVWAEHVALGRHGLSATVHDRQANLAFSSSLLGQHNLENLLVAWGILASLGIAPEDIRAALSEANGVAGRLERCEGPLDDIVVVVDYAHTPDALKRVLHTLRSLDFPQLSCVFGCGGDRDRAKRPLMGRAVAALADAIYVTSDNPRTEEPQAILDDIVPGLIAAQGEVKVEPDRKASILEAILEAKSGSCVLIAGKGHEDYQILGTERVHFDDREQARAALALRRRRFTAEEGD